MIVSTVMNADAYLLTNDINARINDIEDEGHTIVAVQVVVRGEVFYGFITYMVAS